MDHEIVSHGDILKVVGEIKGRLDTYTAYVSEGGSAFMYLIEYEP